MFDFVVVIPTDPKEAVFYSKVAGIFKERGKTVAFLTTSKKVQKILESRNLRCWNVFELAREYGIYIKDFLKGEKSVTSLYGIGDLGDFVFPEMMYWEGKEGLLRKRAVLFFRVMERFVSENKIDCFVQNSGGEILRRVVFHVCKKNGIKNFFIAYAALPGRRSALFFDEMFVWDDIRLVKYSDIPKKEREWLEDMIESVKRKKMVFVRKSRKSLKENIKKPFKHIKAEIDKKISDDPSLSAMGLKNYHKKAKQVSRKWLFRKYLYSQPSEREDYVFFPLHVTNDSQITMRAPQFAVQEVLLEKIADALPEGVMLYVKPHPGCYLYSFRKLRKVSKRPNVRIIAPEMNAHELIKNAKSVITINSSVGFEALFYFKPVITLGRAFYRGHGITIDVNSPDELKEAVKKAITLKVNKEKVKAFIYSAYKATWPGNVYSDDRKNLSNLVTSFIGKSKNMGKKNE